MTTASELITLQDITAKRRFGWFAVKQDLSPEMKWANSLKQGNLCAQYTWEAGPRVGSFTDMFFKRNWQLPWQIGTNPRRSVGGGLPVSKPPLPDIPRTIQLVGADMAGEAMTYARETLQQRCNESEEGTWKIFLVDAYSYLTKGLNKSSHVRCLMEVKRR